MKLAEWNYVGPRSTPHDIRNLRKSSFDYHRDKGQPVIHKHRWNWRDVREGRAQRCPFHDVEYDSDSQFDPYCYGTGFLGGWADGVVTFVTISDVQQDTIRILPQGQLLFETHPGFTAPWTPLMGDGDLLITGEFDSSLWNLLTEDFRYVLQEVTPRTIRGERRNRGGFRVHQQGNLDKLPDNHKWLTVPVVFDYNSVPPAPIVPPGGDPDDYPVVGSKVSTVQFNVRVTGQEGGPRVSTERNVKVTGLGTSSSRSQDVRLGADTHGTVVVFEVDS